MTMNIFERAARNKLRFSSNRGLLITENLFDLNLEDLNKIAIDVNSTLKEQTQESFIEVKTNSVQKELELKLDILKHVIESKQKAAKAAETRMENATRKRILEEALVKKKDAELMKMSAEDIAKELEKLQG